MADNKTLNKDLIGKKTKAVPVKDPEIGIDTSSNFVYTLLDEIDNDKVDLNTIESFDSVAQTRETTYALIDSMACDDRVSAVLETYTEDTVETNEHGQIIWCESSDDEVNQYITYLINSLDIDKYAYEWVYSLIKYGDLYLRLYKESDYDEDLIFKTEDKENKTLNEDLESGAAEKEKVDESVMVAVHSKNDHYVHYVEMVPNPAEMFELTKYGKTMGYIKAPTKVQTVTDESLLSYSNYLSYKMKKGDITIYDSTDFVHCCLKNDNSIRHPEEVTIFLNDDDYNADKAAGVYKVKKGQSILYNTFRVWRELSLMENTVLLNRVTKSAIIRILSIEVGDMPKEQITPFIKRLKEKIEQKTAINVGNNINDYTNPGPIENTIYVPTHESVGSITSTVLGGDYDPKSLTDLDYFQNKFYGALRVPKQFFNQTDDSTGFNGGTSLAIISSRYGKAIKKIQNVFCQMITDLINLFLFDKGLKTYVNRFRIRMQTPVTQEELDRRENMRNRMGVVNDVMNQVSNVIDDPILKVKILKSLLSQTVTDPEVISLLQEHIDKLEEEAEAKEESGEDKKKTDKGPKGGGNTDIDVLLGGGPSGPTPEGPEETPEGGEEIETPAEPTEGPTGGEESYLPSPDEMGLDLTANG